MVKKGLNSNTLKFIAIIAMTVDHLISVIFPNYPMNWWIILLHIFGRITAPIMWFFIAEGYHYTHDLKKYITRMFVFAIISHFAYNFAFGIPFIPFQTSIFNQTSVIWSLAWGLIVLMINDNKKLSNRKKICLVLLICALTFCSDWSCVAVLAIAGIGKYRGNFRKQMTEMLVYVSFYTAIYFIFVNKVYGLIQMFVALSIPLLYSYNGERGSWKGMKWFFYLYYPLHLVVCGIIRILLHGNVGVMIGG